MRTRSKLLTTLIATGFVAICVAAPGVANDRAAGTAAKTKSCRSVNVRFEPDGEGGAVNIRVRNVGCRKARRVVRQCINGVVSSGWTASVNSDFSRITLKSGSRRIAYTPAGGGGCVPI